MRKISWILGILAMGILILLALFTFWPTIAAWSAVAPGQTFRRIPLIVGGKSMQVEVAETEAQRRQGLSKRKLILPESGMLFLFPQPGSYSFWMKDTWVPLDILWISNHRIVEKVHLPPQLPGQIPASHTPTVQADAVLELASGSVERLDLRLGDGVWW